MDLGSSSLPSDLEDNLRMLLGDGISSAVSGTPWASSTTSGFSAVAFCQLPFTGHILRVGFWFHTPFWIITPTRFWAVTS
jgi:hypothetical protein